MNNKKTDLILGTFLLMIVLGQIFFDVPIVVKMFSSLFSFSIFIYMMYKFSFMKQFFGKEHDQHVRPGGRIKNFHLDLLIILAMILMGSSEVFFKFFLEGLREESIMLGSDIANIILDLAKFFSKNANLMFISGSLMLVFLSIYLGTRIKFERPSLFSIIHEDFFPKNFKQDIWRSLLVFVVLNGFFLFFFKNFMEWFVFVMDAPIVFVMVIGAFFFLKNKHHKKFSATNIIRVAGDTIETIYERSLEMLHQKSKIRYLLSFILVLHLLNDFAGFVFPFLLGGSTGVYDFNYDQSYLTQMLRGTIGSSHPIGAAFLYISVLISLIYFLLGPLLIWIKSFRNKGIKIDAVILGVIAASLSVLFFKSFFGMEQLRGEGLAGVELIFEQTQDFTLGADYVFILAAFFGILVWGFAKNRRVRRIITGFSLLPMLGFFTTYIWLFAASVIGYYADMVLLLLAQGRLYLMAFMTLFLILSAAFYIISYVMFLFNLFEEEKRIWE